MKLFQKISNIDKYTKLGILLVILNLFWHLKLSFLIPEPFYSNNYSLFKDIEVTSAWICCSLFTYNYINKYLKLFIAILIFSNVFSIFSVLVKIENIFYYYITNWIFGLGITICLIFFILNYERK